MWDHNPQRILGKRTFRLPFTVEITELWLEYYMFSGYTRWSGRNVKEHVVGVDGLLERGPRDVVNYSTPYASIPERNLKRRSVAPDWYSTW